MASIHKTEPSYSVTVYVAGDIADARRSLRQQAMEEGLCVTLTPTTFIYTAGAEEGVAVGFINYPRFPKTPGVIWGRAVEVAERLMVDMCQHSACVVGPDETLWLTRRPGDTT